MPACDDLDDIEDFVKPGDITPNDRISPRKSVFPKVNRKKISNGQITDQEKPVGDSIIPGTQSIYVRTWGCTHNNSDSEYMSGQLAAYGYKITGMYSHQYHIHTSP